MVNGKLHAYNQITPEGHPKIKGADKCSVGCIWGSYFSLDFLFKQIEWWWKKKRKCIWSISVRKPGSSARAGTCSVWQLGMNDGFKWPRGRPGICLETKGMSEIIFSFSIERGRWQLLDNLRNSSLPSSAKFYSPLCVSSYRWKNLTLCLCF